MIFKSILKPFIHSLYSLKRNGIMFLIVLTSVFGFFFSHPMNIIAQEELFPDLFSVSFSSENNGWTCGRWGTILHTENGGKDWEKQTSGTDYTLSDIFFKDSMYGWAVGDGGTIIHTNDGGRTWVKQKCPVDNFLQGVHFINVKEGWVVGDKTTIFHTKDGGANWEIAFSDKEFRLKKIYFTDEISGWAAGEYGYIYHTKNGGRSWNQQAGEFYYSMDTGEIVSGAYIFDIAVTDPSTVWAVGISGYISKTSDGGKTWVKQNSDFPKAHLFSVVIDENKTIIIGGNGTLFRSPDNGVSFFEIQDISPPITYIWIYDVCKRGGAGFVAVGKGQSIYMSDKNGVKWINVENIGESNVK